MGYDSVRRLQELAGAFTGLILLNRTCRQAAVVKILREAETEAETDAEPRRDGDQSKGDGRDTSPSHKEHKDPVLIHRCRRHSDPF